MEIRKHYKHMKSKRRLENNKSQEVICDQIQYALKISANSMYGALSYAEYNTYSPRCVMGVTAGGQCYVNVAMSVCWCMGFSIVYGDTDSIMFTIHVKVYMNRRYPMRPYVAIMMNDRPIISLHTVSEYISRSSGCENKFPKKLYYMCNILPRIINLIVSYTCM